MAARGIDPNNFKYYPPNVAGDIRGNKTYIFIGSFNKMPTQADWGQESIRVLVIKANFESKEVIHKLGNIAIMEKTPSNRYDWKVIKASIQALYQDRWGGFKITSFLLFGIPVAISIGLVSLGILLSFSKKSSYDAEIAALIMLYIATGTFHVLKSYVDYFKENFLPLIEQAQKPYLDRFVVFQQLDQIPKSIGFDPMLLANERTATGWINPITRSVISRNQISSAQILRIRQHAIPIIDGLKVMLTRHCSTGELHHPITDDHLTSEEKTKFLRDVSSFFNISTSELNACWDQTVTIQELVPFIYSIPHLHRLPDEMKVCAILNLYRQLIVNKQKQAFLKLLPASIAQAYFDDQFRSEEIIVPNPALLLQVPPRTLALMYLILLSEVARLQQN